MRKILFSILLLLFAGVQTTKAQQMIVVTKDGDAASFNAQDLECVLFAEAGNYEFVDLGLPSGTLWATCNVGAENPEDYGDYLAWGETKAKESYSWGNYKWMTQGQDGWQYVNKYTFEDGQTNACWYSGSTFVGDGKRELLKGDDAAFMNWGGKCQMPTDKQLEELTNSTYTTQEYTTRNGVKGLKITGKNGKSIFLPASGWVLDTLYGNVEEGGYYWSCAAGPSYSDRASYLFFSYSMAGNAMSNGDRYVGRSVRPVIVRVKEHEYVDLGLPSGTLWATCNVGANSPQEYGYYFAWGETEPKSDYSWSNYKWCKGTDRTMTKYCSESGYGYNGFTDVLVELHRRTMQQRQIGAATGRCQAMSR